MTKIYGIDVSHHQGTINWENVAAELRRVNGGNSPGFAILRAGYSKTNGKGGLVTDGQILRNLAACNRLGIPCGVYCYCYDQSATAAASTMAQVMQLVKGYKLEYPVIYDVEYEQYNRTAGKAANTAMIRAAMAEVERAGYYGMVYCSRDFFRNYTNLSELAGFDKWEAAYTSTDTSAVPDNGIWQYGSANQLRIEGFGNSLDCDVAYKDYPAIIRAAGLNGLAADSTDAEDNETVDDDNSLVDNSNETVDGDNADAVMVRPGKLYRLVTGAMSAGDVPAYAAALGNLRARLGVEYSVQEAD